MTTQTANDAMGGPDTETDVAPEASEGRKTRTLGQKRKRRARLVAFAAFAAATYLAMSFVGGVTDERTAWMADPAVAQGTVVELIAEEEEYRNRKGRLRTETVHFLEYEFELDGELHGDWVEVPRATFDAHRSGGPVEVWYDPEYPYTHLPRDAALGARTAGEPAALFLAVAPYTVGVGLFVMFLLNFLYVRESAGELPEGFYTETSWLDVDDHQMVFVDDESIGWFGFESSRTRDVQGVFQRGSSVAAVLDASKAKSVKTVRFDAIDRLVSRDDRDTLGIEVGKKHHSIEFLNPRVKAHALERIAARLPASLERDEVRRTRLRAALPSLAALGALGALAYWLGGLVLPVLIGIVALVKVVPRLVRRLLRPTRVHTWARPAAERSGEALPDAPVRA